MGSSRFPGKIMEKIGNQMMLSHVIKQTLASKFVDDVIIATTSSKKDKQIVDFCKKNNLRYFCGSSHDVLDRYYQCAKFFSCDPIVRISSDCPFIDPIIIDKVISKFLKNSYDYVSNNFENIGGKYQNSLCNFPQGMVVEISTFKTLEKAWKMAKKPSEREHVFPYVQFNPSSFKTTNIKNRKNLSLIRCTVDKTEDIKFVNKIWANFSKSKKIIHVKDIVSIVTKQPNLLKILYLGLDGKNQECSLPA